jgi:hypothetical protein
LYWTYRRFCTLYARQPSPPPHVGEEGKQRRRRIMNKYDTKGTNTVGVYMVPNHEKKIGQPKKTVQSKQLITKSIKSIVDNIGRNINILTRRK